MARRARQQEDLPAPGMSRVDRPEVEESAEDLRAISGEIATLNERKRAAQAALLAAMQAAGVELHKYLDSDGQERAARVTLKPKVSVERSKGQKAADEDADAGVEVS